MFPPLSPPLKTRLDSTADSKARYLIKTGIDQGCSSTDQASKQVQRWMPHRTSSKSLQPQFTLKRKCRTMCDKGKKISEAFSLLYIAYVNMTPSSCWDCVHKAEVIIQCMNNVENTIWYKLPEHNSQTSNIVREVSGSALSNWRQVCQM